MVLPELKKAVPKATFSAIDALAALSTDGDLLLSIVHRGSHGPIHLNVTLENFKAGGHAELRTLTADKPWAANSLTKPEIVRPLDSSIALRENMLELDLPPYTVLQARIPRIR